MIYETLNKLFKKEDLTDIEIKETFDEINQGLAGSFLACAFIVALKSKGETIDEITNAIISSKEAIKKINLFHFHVNFS